VEDGFAETEYRIVLGNTDNDAAKERRSLTGMLELQVDGLLLAMARRRDPLIEELRNGPTPFVLVNRTIDRGGVSAVIPDDQAGMSLAVEHLYDLGHRAIGHVAGPSNTSTGARRAAGFSAAAALLRLPRGPVVRAEAFGEAAGLGAGRAILSRTPAPTAIVAANDLIALGVIEAAEQSGLRCPEDLSVIGFNDMPFADKFSPPLTTVRISEYQIGLRAAELLRMRIEHPDQPPETVLIAPELVVRGSTAAPRTDSSV
jgi:LacI family transcriptional regulator